jgi:TetR/AcrR family transcriptional regulator
MKKPGNKRRDGVRLEILRSAATAFRRSGYHGTNMIQIADAVGMTKSNLYNYFKTKEDILFFCHQYGMARLLKTFDRIDRKPYPPEVKLRRLIAEFIHLMVDELDGEILALEAKELTGARLRRVIAMRDKLDRCMRRTIANGVKSGSFRQMDPKLVAFTIWGAMNWIPRWFKPSGPAGSVEISDAMVDCFLDGMRNHTRRRKR